jgi:hypothetical protein
MSYIHDHPNYFSDGTHIKNDLTNLIKMEINAHPIDVGLPIVIKVVYPAGSKWLTPHQYCK